MCPYTDAHAHDTKKHQLLRQFAKKNDDQQNQEKTPGITIKYVSSVRRTFLATVIELQSINF